MYACVDVYNIFNIINQMALTIKHLLKKKIFVGVAVSSAQHSTTTIRKMKNKIKNNNFCCLIFI